jgi:hypothetical protein
MSYIPLATITLTGNDAEIAFSNIPANFKDLMLSGNLRTDRSATSEPLRVRFNGDSTNGNYARVSMHGTGSSAASYTDAPTEVIVDVGATGASASSGVFSVFNLEVLDYATTDKHKTGLTASDIAGVETRRQAFRWASTSAITSISVSAYFGGNFVSGSSLSLYGVA